MPLGSGSGTGHTWDLAERKEARGLNRRIVQPARRPEEQACTQTFTLHFFVCAIMPFALFRCYNILFGT